MAIDLDKLLKILGMTGSAHDAEALTALRKAQALMKEAKITWADLLKHKPMQHQNDASAYRPPQYSDIFRQATKDPYYQANRAAYEAEQKAKAKKTAEQNQAEYEELIRRYKAQQNVNSQRSPGFSDGLYEVIFGRKRNK